MKYIPESVELEEILQNKNFNPSLDFMKRTLHCVAEAIDEAHKLNILHRNISADQVLCTKQEHHIKLTGFKHATKLNYFNKSAHGYNGQYSSLA